MKNLYFIGRISIVFLVTMMISISSFAQDEKVQEEDHSYKPLKLNLSEDGKKYVRFIMWHQLWLTTNNLDTDGGKFALTPSIRRSRFLAFSQISSKFLILTHFGLNGLSPNNLSSLGSNGDAPQLFLHGAWGELKVNDGLYIGSGLHYWKGLTRLANASTLNFMTLDQSRPFVQWHSLGITDQFARHLGVYAKGAVGKFDYRVAFNAPSRSPLGAGRNYGDNPNNLSSLIYTGRDSLNRSGDPTGGLIVEGYFRYNLWDKEGSKLPYNVGTYLGKKKVLAIGAGFFAHPNGMYDTATDEHSNVSHVAVDAFMEYPLTSGDMLHAYASFINFNYGDNYVSRWAGTGSNFYAQLGYYAKSAKIMPYVAFQNGSYDGYTDPLTSLDIGLNYYVNGHFSKITLEYHKNTGAVDATSQIRMQLHVFL